MRYWMTLSVVATVGVAGCDDGTVDTDSACSCSWYEPVEVVVPCGHTADIEVGLTYQVLLCDDVDMEVTVCRDATADYRLSNGVLAVDLVGMETEGGCEVRVAW